MKKPINEAAKLKRLAGLITESEYQESLMNETMYYVHDEEGMEEPIGPFTMDQAKQELAKQGAGWKMIDAATAKQIWSYLEDDMNEAKEKVEGLNKAFGGINENSYLMAKNPDVKAKVDKIIELLIDIDVDGETMEYILGAVGMDDQMANQLVHNKAGLNERLEPHVYERMYNLSNIKAQQAMIRAAEILMNDLTAEGFEVEEIREFFHILIANDI